MIYGKPENFVAKFWISHSFSEEFYGRMSVLSTGHLKTILHNRGSVAGSVIQDTGTVEFEDGLGTEVLWKLLVPL